MDKFVNATNISLNDSTRNISKPLVIYCTISVITILIGIVVNIIVIAAYKLGDRKLKNNNNSNTNNNVNNNTNNANTARINKLLSSINENHHGSIYKRTTKPVQNRRVSLAVTPTSSSSNSSKRIPKTLNQDKKKYSKSDNLVDRNKIRRNTSDFQTRNFVRNNSYLNLNTTITCDAINSNRNRRSVCSYFILSLGCCDLLICILNMPFNLVIESGVYDLKITQLFAYSKYADTWCKLAYFLAQIPIVLEIEILLTIAVDRYSSVFHPIKFYFFDKNKSKLTILAQILISCLISLPNLLFFASSSTSVSNSKQHSTLNFNSNNITFYSIYSLSNYCQVKDDYSSIYSYYQMILFSFFLLNLLIIIIFYIKVYNHIYKVSKHQRIESIGSRASACTNSSIYLTNHLTNSMSVIQQGNEDSINNNHNNQISNRKLNLVDKISSYIKKKSSKTSMKTIASTIANTSKEIELEASNLENIEEFEIKEEEQQSNQEADLDEDNLTNNLNETKINKSLLYAPNDNNGNASSTKRRISCPLVVIQGHDEKPVNDPIRLSQLNEIKQQKMKSKRFRTSSTRSNEMNSNAINTKWTTSVINRLRRFSENHNSFYSRSSASNYYDFQTSSLSVPANTIIFRRHTTRIFRHGKTARILGIATLAFALTWIPYWYYTFKYTANYPIRKTNVSCFVLFQFVKNSFYLNYVLNPLFYSFVNQRFRKNVYILFHIVFKFLTKCFCCRFERRGNNYANNNDTKLNSMNKKVTTNKDVETKSLKKKSLIVVNYDNKTKRAVLTNNSNGKTGLSFRKIICFCCSKLSNDSANLRSMT